MMKLACALLLGSTALAPAVQAAPMLWTLSDVAFVDASSFPETFDYDTDTNSYSNIDIATTPDFALPSGRHTSYVPSAHVDSPSAFASVFTSLAADRTGVPDLLINPSLANPTGLNPMALNSGLLNLGLPLTRAGGVLDADYAGESVCAIATCDFWATNDGASGYAEFISATAVLIPKSNSIALLGVALVGFVMMCRPKAVRSS